MPESSGSPASKTLRCRRYDRLAGLCWIRTHSVLWSTQESSSAGSAAPEGAGKPLEAPQTQEEARGQTREETRDEEPRDAETRTTAPASSTGSAAEPERARGPADSQRVR